MKRVPVAVLGLVACFGGAPKGAVPVPGSRQLVVVTTSDWNATTGWLRQYERVAGHPAWRPVGDSVPVVVGRAGLAWGRGVRGDPRPDDPTKVEGDGKSPAGEFQLSHAFGYAPADSARWLRLRYLWATPALKCVDDPASARYNELIYQPAEGPPEWQSAEDMRRADEAYRWGIVVQHNSGWAREPGAGSCIFLHVWSGPSSSTVGCTAMDAGRLVELMRWLDPLRTPVLVQLPRGEYQRLRREWDLP
jgi:L,D-peptidoglycan transpeptidase YkuD (ErfK/YbiS/YcfS/YnhG family)